MAQSTELKNYRMQQKRDYTKSWSDSSFFPKDGEIIVYKDENSISRIKIGDGENSLDNLKFITGEVYVQAELPQDAGNGAIWINPTNYGSGSSGNSGGGSGSTVGNLVSWETMQSSDEVTLNYTLEDGSTHTDVITFDANGYPVSITHDGFEATGTWSEVSDG